MNSTSYLTQTTSQILKARFKETQEELREQQSINLPIFRSFVFDREPVFNCPEGWKKIEDTWYHKTPNIRVVELINEFKNHAL